mgnify:CR=1 FL=1
MFLADNNKPIHRSDIIWSTDLSDLNIKFIVLSNRDYEERNRKPYTESNIVICSSDAEEKRIQEIENIMSGKMAKGIGDRDARDVGDKSKMKEQRSFNPDYYIILSHTGSHYELITCRDTAMFTFPEIPFSIKLQIINRCIETSSGNIQALSGSFRRIPQFIMFYQHELGLGDFEKLSEQGGGNGSAASTHILTANPHFDPSIVLIYHSDSTDELPGNAQGDHVSNANKNAFIPLIASGKGKNNWRKKLSNEWYSKISFLPLNQLYIDTAVSNGDIANLLIPDLLTSLLDVKFNKLSKSSLKRSLKPSSS